MTALGQRGELWLRGEVERLQKMIMIERLSTRLGALERLPEVAGEFETQWSLICKRVATEKRNFCDRGRQIPQKKGVRLQGARECSKKEKKRGE